MDPSLLRERELFRKRALAVPTVEKRKAKDESGPSKPSKKPKPRPTQSSDYKTMAGTSQYKFGVLAKIVKHMKQRHMDGDLHPLNIDEILDETNQTDIGIKQKHWLVTEALLNNPKIDIIGGECYKYKPKYNIRDRKGLLRLLDKHDQRGQGGILMEDIEESLPNSAKAFKILGDSIIYVTRPIDKKKVLFYNDKSFAFTVDEDITKLWRGAAVDGVDENKIEEYLERQGITSMSDIAAKRVNIQKRKKSNKKKNRVFKSHNDHLEGVLQDYSKD